MSEYVLTPLSTLKTVANTVKEIVGVDEIPLTKIDQTVASAVTKPPEISVNSSNGLITATAGSSSTYQLAFQPAKTITPAATSQTAVSSGYYTDGAVTVEGDSNLIADNIKSGVSIFGVNGTYEGSGGGTNSADEFITKTITSYSGNVSYVASQAFYGCTNLTTINMPYCTEIRSNAFQYCTKLTDISIPVCTSIGGGAFYQCLNLTTVSFPACTLIGYSAFASCSNLTTINLPTCRTISGYAFASCSNLTNVSLPVCTNISNNAFQYCKSLTVIDLPNCEHFDSRAFLGCTGLTSISIPVARGFGYSAFQGCTGLTSINLPACTGLTKYVFMNCTNLSTINMPNCTVIWDYAFSSCLALTSMHFKKYIGICSNAFLNCANLSQIYLEHSTICGLSNSNAFTNTMITSTTGSIFVPPLLVDTYKSATNWAYFSNIIFVMHGLYDITENTILVNNTKNFTITTVFDSIPTNISITPLTNECISISNIQANTSNITFDITSYNIEGEVEIEVCATENEEIYKDIFTIQIFNPIGNLNEKINPNSTKIINIPLNCNGITPDDVSVISNDNSLLTISDIVYDAENITFHITSYNTKVGDNIGIDVSIVYNGRIYNKALTIAAVNEPYYFIEDLGDTYGFIMNSNGYYVSNNKGISRSYALCKLKIFAPYDCTMYLDCINSGENDYDYGILSNLNTELSSSHSADSTSNVYKSFKGLSSTSIQTISYAIPAGEHFIYIKFIKDGSGNNNYDSLQFKVRFE